MLEVVGARRQDVLTAGDVAETERDALGNVSEGAGPLDEAGGPAATAKGRPSKPDAPEGGLGDKLSQPAGDRRAAVAMRSRVEAAKLAIAREAVSQFDDSEELEGASGMYDAGHAAKKAAGRLRQRKAKKAAQGSRKAATALGAPKGGVRGPEAAGATAPAKHQAAQAAAQASGEAARAAGSKGAASAIAEAAPFDPAARAASPDACAAAWAAWCLAGAVAPAASGPRTPPLGAPSAVAALRLPWAAFFAFLCRSLPAAFLAACPASYMPEAPSSSSESSNWETASRAIASFAASTRERIATAARRSPAGWDNLSPSPPSGASGLEGRPFAVAAGPPASSSGPAPSETFPRASRSVSATSPAVSTSCRRAPTTSSIPPPSLGRATVTPSPLAPPGASRARRPLRAWCSTGRRAGL